MKKFFSILTVCLVTFCAMSLTSCKSVQFGMVYNVTVSGDGDGDFQITFPQGSYAMTGKATMELAAKDTIPFNQVTTKEVVLKKNKKKEMKALQYAQEQMNAITATSGQGTYDVTIDGTVTIYPLGINFGVHKRLTNREQVLMDSNDLYSYIR